MRYGTWRPLDEDTFDQQPLLSTPDIISLHTMVGTLAGTDGMFRRNGYRGTFSHFGVGGDGTVWQWQDTRYRAAANYLGNHRIISVETADLGAPFPVWDTTGSDVPAWSPAQVEALARMIAVLCVAHDIPCELIPDSRAGRRGIGYHRQGIDGSFLDHRVADGELWSTVRSKVCPGSRRIAQIGDVLVRARELIPTTPNLEAPMPLSTDDLHAVRDVVWRAPIDDVNAPVPPGAPLAQLQAWQHMQWANGHAERASAGIDELRGRLGELQAAVLNLAAGGVDYQLLSAALADELLGRLAAAGTPTDGDH